MKKAGIRPRRADARAINEIVRAYVSRRGQFEQFRDMLLPSLSSAPSLSPLVHSIRHRIKDPVHLRDKLLRKLMESRERGNRFRITADNFAWTVNDLVGVRVLHLHTRQLTDIDAALQDALKEASYKLVEGPIARTWDDEYREYFRAKGIRTLDSPTMYTSVHYVIGSASRTRLTAEIQVRTLMEEVWGEVDHLLNYPKPNASLPCREQLKVLARVASGAGRLVDSIFVTHEDYLKQTQDRRKARARRVNRYVPAKGRR
jgi:putative GTP pyrophosphokinase